MTKKRKLFDELIEGFDSLADYRAGKRTLCTHVLKAKPAPKITARELCGRSRTGSRDGRGRTLKPPCLSAWCSATRTPFVASPRLSGPE